MEQSPYYTFHLEQYPRNSHAENGLGAKETILMHYPTADDAIFNLLRYKANRFNLNRVLSGEEGAFIQEARVTPPNSDRAIGYIAWEHSYVPDGSEGRCLMLNQYYGDVVSDAAAGLLEEYELTLRSEKMFLGYYDRKGDFIDMQNARFELRDYIDENTDRTKYVATEVLSEDHAEIPADKTHPPLIYETTYELRLRDAFRRLLAIDLVSFPGEPSPGTEYPTRYARVVAPLESPIIAEILGHGQIGDAHRLLKANGIFLKVNEANFDYLKREVPELLLLETAGVSSILTLATIDSTSLKITPTPAFKEVKAALSGKDSRSNKMRGKQNHSQPGSGGVKRKRR